MSRTKQIIATAALVLGATAAAASPALADTTDNVHITSTNASADNVHITVAPDNVHITGNAG